MKQIIAVLVLCLVVGCSIADGPYRDVSGVVIDLDEYEALVENSTTMSDVVGRIGEPSARREISSQIVELRFIGVVQRESIERTGFFKKKHLDRRQWTVSLLFRNGVLHSKSRTSEVID